MKATELIEKLKQAVATYGDMDVVGGGRECPIDEIQVTNPLNSSPVMRLRQLNFPPEKPLEVCSVCGAITRSRKYSVSFREHACPDCLEKMMKFDANLLGLRRRLIQAAEEDVANQRREWMKLQKVSK